MPRSLRGRAIRLAASLPENSPVRQAVLDVLANLGLGSMRDGSRTTIQGGKAYAHVWFDQDQYARDDFGRRNDDAVEWQVTITTSEDPLNREPRGRELARKTFRSVEKKTRSQVQSYAEDWIRSSLSRLGR